MRAARTLFVLLVLAAVAVPAGGARAAEQLAALTPADQATVAKVERALDSIRTMKSHFVQTSSNGAVAEGTLWLSRPGNLRINYAPPQHMQIVVQGTWLIQVDTKLDTLTYVGLSRTPAEILVSNKIEFGKSVKVTGIKRANGLLRVGLVRRDAEDQGNLVLVLEEPSLELRQWVVTDSQGIVTRVTLTDPVTNVTIDPKVFAFDASKYDRNAIQ